MIEVKNLLKKYGNHVAVDDLSFTVEDGQILGFLGPNGAGKSTTMNILTGYISSTEGTVTIDGHDIFEEPEEAKKCIGYLPEQPPLYMDMTVYEYLRFVAELKGVKKNERAKMIRNIIDETKLVEVQNRLIHHLSKGYKQRVGIAEALMGYPKVIILDEPTVGLDPSQIIEIRDLIKKLAKNHTVILSSHILSEVSAVCDHVMIINKGKLIVSDTPDNLINYTKQRSGLRLIVKGTKDIVKEILDSIGAITDTKLEKEEDGLVYLTAYTSEKEDIREMVFYAMAEAKCPIFGMELLDLSLEDVFLELTTEQKGDK